jgi:hypothetical protein
MTRSRKALVALTTGVLLAVAGTAVALDTAEPAPPAPAAQMWEYRWAIAQPGGRNVGDLEKLGKEGWEVVAPVNAYTGDRWNFLLKRPLRSG